MRNNSAWNHRYFIVFGADELGLLGGDEAGANNSKVVDVDVVDREIEYAQARVRWAPNNASAWNYLRGVLRRAGLPLPAMTAFCEGFVGGPGADLWKEVEVEGGAGVASAVALEWLAEIYMQARELERSRECWEALATKWDPVRSKYWMWRAGGLDLEGDGEVGGQGREEEVLGGERGVSGG